MPLEYAINYTPKLLRAATTAYFRIQIGPWFPVVLAFIAGSVGYRAYMGDRSWLVGAGGAFVVLIVVILGGLVVTYLQRANRIAQELEGESVALRVDADKIEFESVLGHAKIPWAKVLQVHSRSDFVLLQFRGGGFLSIPADALDSKGIDAIKASVIEAGGRVT